MTTATTCPIWGTPATESPSNADGRYIDSPRAGGKYFISGSAETVIGNRDDRIRVRLTTWLIERRRLGSDYPEITTKTVNDAEYWRDSRVKDRLDNVLTLLARKSGTMGERIGYHILDNTYNVELIVENKAYLELLAHSGSINKDDFLFLIRYLENRDLIEYHGALRYNQSCTVTVDGYARLDELDKTFTTSSRAFIAMWFDDSMNDAWERGISPAVRDAGFDPVRIDQKEHVNKIDDEIVAEIRRSRFVVADFTQGATGARGGVYYEAGFAHGLGIPVIFTCRQDTLDKVHFDTRQYNHIVWTESEELRESLKNRIAAAIGDGPNKTSD